MQNSTYPQLQSKADSRWSWPELPLLIVAFAVYLNLPVIIYQFHGIPQAIATSIGLLLLIPLIYYGFIRREGVIIDDVFTLMWLFLGVLIVSSIFAKDLDVAGAWITEFILEGLLLYFLLINSIRRLSTLRRVIGAVLLAGAIMGGLSLYQQVTLSYHNEFGGLAQRTLTYDPTGEHFGGAEMGRADRAEGPIGEPNRFAQVMIMLAPLGFFFWWDERSRWLRFFAAGATILVLAAVVISYSRGAFLTFLVLLGLLVYFRYVPVRLVAGACLLLILMTPVLAPGYLSRVQSLAGVEGLIDRHEAPSADQPILGRATEMLAAFLAFRDHPLLGVGPGQYAPFFSRQYQLNPDVAFRSLPQSRRAHTLYFELAAETGIVGLMIFMSIVILVLKRLWSAHRRWQEVRPDLSNLAMAFFLSILAYLGTAVFLHLAYQRYFWFLMALSGATVHILRRREQATTEETTHVYATS